jgi:hypothetical protein
MKTINNMEDIIDSRDIIERIDELEDLLNDDFECPDCEQSEPIPDWGEKEVCPHCGEGQSIDVYNEREELKTLTQLASDCKDYSEDWEYGAILIRDTYFQEYAQDLAEDIGAIDSNASWPNTCIDWEQATRELQMDYTSASFDGIDYWVR